MPTFKVRKGKKEFRVEADGPNHAAAAVANMGKKAAPKKKAAPVPAKPSALEVRLIQQIDAIATEFHASNAVTLELAEQIKAKSDGVKESHSWSFDIERGHDGFITRIVANPIRLN